MVAGLCFLPCSLTYPACKRSCATLSAASMAPPYYLTLSYKRHDLRKNVTERKICILIFFTNSSKTFVILRRNWRDNYINVKTSTCKVNVIDVRL
jgi:hypothetical protein